MASKRLASPRPQRTRAALIAAGLDLLVERPIDAIPIDDIVTRAGVAKGSFFNHFTDKQEFAAAVAAEVRLDVESAVTRANAGIADPVIRIAGGMRVAAAFALEQPSRAMVLLRLQVPATGTDHPLNAGLKEDIAAALAAGQVRPEAGEAGVPYWLGLCQVLMIRLLDGNGETSSARQLIESMLLLGLTGLGVPLSRAVEIGGASAEAREARSPT